MQILPGELSFDILKAKILRFLSLVWNLIFILSELNLDQKTRLELEVTKNE